MFWSLTKVVGFLAIIAGVAFGGVWVSKNSSDIRLWAFDMEFTLAPLTAVIAVVVFICLVWVMFKILGLGMAIFHFLNGDETAVSRYFDRNRERRGYDALSEGLVALAGGENTLALARAKTASRLLHKPELTLLLTAQAAEAAGDTKIATEAWKSLLTQEDTRFVAIRGLIRQKLAQGDTKTALQLAKQAAALKPRHGETQDLLLKLQADDGDWAGARDTLSQKARSGALPKSLYRRRDALLALQQAKTILDEGETIEAREAAIEANKLSPDLIPAAVIAAKALIEQGDKRNAARILSKAWAANPHPDLAATFAQIEPDETPSARLKRFTKFLASQADSLEAKLTLAELYLADDDFTQAAKIIAPLVKTDANQHVLAIQAAAARGMGASEHDIAQMVTAALQAPPGPQWCCDNCGTPYATWSPICASCDGFDTLTWRVPDAAHQAKAAPHPTLAPLLLNATTTAPQIESPIEIAEEVIIEDDAKTGEILPPEEDWPQDRPDDILRRAN